MEIMDVDINTILQPLCVVPLESKYGIDFQSIKLIEFGDATLGNQLFHSLQRLKENTLTIRVISSWCSFVVMM